LVGELKDLNSVRAPEGFLKELHERIESQSGFLRLVQALFKPMKFKIPLELATAGVVAILVISLFNIQQEEEKVVGFPKAMEEKGVLKEPVEPEAPSVVKKAAKVAPVPGKTKEKKKDATVRRLQRDPSEKRASRLGDEMTIAPVKSQPRNMIHKKEITDTSSESLSSQEVDGVKGGLRSPALKQGESIAVESKTKKITVELRILVEGAPSGRVLEKNQGPSRDRFVGKETPTTFTKRTARPAPAESDMKEEGSSFETEEEKAFSAADNIKSTDVNAITQKIEDLVKSFDGKIIGVQYDEAENRPRMLDVEIPAEMLKAFCGELNRVAFMKFSCPEKEENVDALHSITVKIIFEKIE
jgi:hypothetical protein